MSRRSLLCCCRRDGGGGGGNECNFADTSKFPNAVALTARIDISCLMQKCDYDDSPCSTAVAPEIVGGTAIAQHNGTGGYFGSTIPMMVTIARTGGSECGSTPTVLRMHWDLSAEFGPCPTARAEPIVDEYISVPSSVPYLATTPMVFHATPQENCACYPATSSPGFIWQPNLLNLFARDCVAQGAPDCYWPPNSSCCGAFNLYGMQFQSNCSGVWCPISDLFPDTPDCGNCYMGVAGSASFSVG